MRDLAWQGDGVAAKPAVPPTVGKFHPSLFLFQLKHLSNAGGCPGTLPFARSVLESLAKGGRRFKGPVMGKHRALCSNPEHPKNPSDCWESNPSLGCSLAAPPCALCALTPFLAPCAAAPPWLRLDLSQSLTCGVSSMISQFSFPPSSLARLPPSSSSLPARGDEPQFHFSVGSVPFLLWGSLHLPSMPCSLLSIPPTLSFRQPAAPECNNLLS